MKLYHGTTEAVARHALDEGLLPRAVSGRASNWQGCPSNEDLVYLTVAYAGYFASQATEELEPWGIVEINTELLDQEVALVPDEDWLEQCCREISVPFNSYSKLSMEERTKFWRKRQLDLSDMWEMSIEGIGNCAHVGKISPKAITRISIFDPKTNPTIAMLATDPTISLLNYCFMADKYRALTRWLMGEETPVGALVGFPAALLPPQLITNLKKAQTQRDGITVERNTR